MILIGFMGSGKTTLGKELAREKNLSFIDLDEYIVKRVGQSIPEIFSKSGEKRFREVEFEALSACLHKNVILSTGGGVVTYEKSYQQLRESSKTIIYLNVSFETAYERIKHDTNRPLVQTEKESLKAIYDSRHSVYQRLADYTVDAERSVQEIIHDVKTLK